MQMQGKRGLAAALSLVGIGAVTLLTTPGTATAHSAPSAPAVARVEPLNNSGVRGTAHASVRVSGDRIDVRVRAGGLLLRQPHAMHIHFSPNAKHQCPTVRQDRNRDHRLNVVEGVPQYGAIAVSLTTRGDTSPKSGLAVDRFLTTPRGVLNYSRGGIKVSKSVAAAIKRGEAVVVIHGLDYNQNLKYDMAGAGASELNPALPAEATDPAACGVLRAHKH